MKKILLIFLLPVLLASSCKKNKSPEEQLPPETQTGAGTFGCLVNGNVFLPKGNPLGGPILSCAYQFINGGYYFHLAAKSQTTALTGVAINTDSLQIKANSTYILEDFFKKHAASGQYFVADNNNISTEYLTKPTITGEMKITRLDEINRIVSGTFWFDAINSSGVKVQVREGRFDMKYTL